MALCIGNGFNRARVTGTFWMIGFKIRITRFYRDFLRL